MIRILSILLLLMACAGASASYTNAPSSLYRINVESGIKYAPDADMTAEDIQAIKRMNRLLKRWPKMLWLANKDGQFIAVKIDPTTGKPARTSK